jgi:hypothetical protein
LERNWKNGKKKREREGRIEEKEREGERGRDEGEQRTRNRPEKTPSNGPIESSNWPWTLARFMMRTTEGQGRIEV